MMRIVPRFGPNLLKAATKLFTRAAYTVRTGYWHSGERCCPDFPDEIFVNHLKAYKFASQFCIGKKVLDIGCGTGYGTSYIAASASRVIGIDISRRAVDYAKRHYGNTKVQFLRMEAEALDFPDRTFELVISSENFEHLRDQRANLREISRVLTDDGMLFLATPNPEMFVEVHNRFHTHEFVYDDLLEIIHEFFAVCSISENLCQPSSEEGMRMKKERRERGAIGVEFPFHANLWGKNIDTQWLSNTHSFFCFARIPRRDEK